MNASLPLKRGCGAFYFAYRIPAESMDNGGNMRTAGPRTLPSFWPIASDRLKFDGGGQPPGNVGRRVNDSPGPARHLLFPTAAIILLFLSGCVSMRTYRIDKEAAYHQGRTDIMKKVEGWLQPDATVENIKFLLASTNSNEEIWQTYFIGKNFPLKESPAPMPWDNQYRRTYRPTKNTEVK